MSRRRKARVVSALRWILAGMLLAVTLPLAALL
jgi:hypothetical protein